MHVSGRRRTFLRSTYADCWQALHSTRRNGKPPLIAAQGGWTQSLSRLLPATPTHQYASDHVVGAMHLVRELARAKKDQLPLPVQIRHVWFNSVDDLVDGVQPGLTAATRAMVDAVARVGAMAASYGQGRDVRSNIAALGLAGNTPIGSNLITGAATQLDGLKVTVIGPSSSAPTDLVEKWRQSIRAADPRVIAAAYADRAIPNLSSIALHLRYGAWTALLTGDARGDHLLAGLEEVGLLPSGGSMQVDVFKLPHHGSDRNANLSLFERIRANHYVVSADGIKHKHPSKDTLKWLVASRRPGDGYTIHLTNRIPAAEAVLDQLKIGHAFQVVAGGPREIRLDA